MRCPAELREILICLVDPEGPAVDYDRLAELLRDDPDARSYYRQFMELHARLELLHDAPLPMPEIEFLSGATAEGLEGEEPRSVRVPGQKQKDRVTRRESSKNILRSSWSSGLVSPQAVAGFACGVLFLLVPLLLWEPWNQAGEDFALDRTAPETTPLMQYQNVGLITRVENCQWRGRPLVVDTRLSPGGMIDLKSGLVDVRMANGAEIVVEGPAQFRLQSSGSGYLGAGQISCNVPENADGFTVLTPSATVVDLGTSFGVWVDDKGATETHVLSGMVGLQPRSDDSEEDTGSVSMISKLQSARITPGPDAKAEFVDYRIERFTSLIPRDRTVSAHPSGGLLYSDGQGVLFGCNSMTGTRRIGLSSLLAPIPNDASNLRLANALIFRLPAIQDSTEIKSAQLEWTFQGLDGSPKFSVDLYGMGYMDLKAFRKDWFYEGSYDTHTRDHYGLGSKDHSVTMLAKGVLRPNTQTGRIVVEGEELDEFLRSLYLDGARGGDVVVFRLNADTNRSTREAASGFSVIHAPAILGKTTAEELPELKLKVSRARTADTRANWPSTLLLQNAGLDTGSNAF